MLEHSLLRIRNYVRPDEPGHCARRTALAEEAGFGESTLRDAGRDGWDPRRSTLERVLSALDRIEARQKTPRDAGAAA